MSNVRGERDRLIKEYGIRPSGTIPGRGSPFDGEMIFAPYFWNEGGDRDEFVHECDPRDSEGDYDEKADDWTQEHYDMCENQTQYTITKPTADDRKEFPELEGWSYVIQYQRDDGFVITRDKSDFTKEGQEELGID